MDLTVADWNPCYQKRDRDGMVVEGRMYVRDVLTHRDYDKGTWKNNCDCS